MWLHVHCFPSGKVGKWKWWSGRSLFVSLEQNTLPTIEDIITLFNFHPKLSEKPMVDTSHKKHDDDDDDDNDDDDDDVLMRKLSWNSLRSFIKDDKEKSVNFFKWLRKIFTPFIYIGTYAPWFNESSYLFLVGTCCPRLGWRSVKIFGLHLTWLTKWLFLFFCLFCQVFFLQCLPMNSAVLMTRYLIKIQYMLWLKNVVLYFFFQNIAINSEKRPFFSALYYLSLFIDI